MKNVMKSLLAFLLAAGVSGCSAKETSASGLTDGTYVSSSRGFGGVVEVALTVADSKIEQAVIKADEETPEIGGQAVEELTAQILDKQSAEIDGVSGATLTSNAVKEAVGACLDQASGNAPVSSVVKDGKYVTKGLGHEGYIDVATEFRDGKIYKVEILRHDETVGIGTFALEAYDPQFERIQDRIVSANSIAVDVVSGATMTCNGVFEAVGKAIQEAGGDPSDFMSKPEVVKNGEEHNEEVDVVIVGAGTAGLIAANKLADEGVKTLVFEKMDIPGGAMAMTYSGIAAAESDMQTAWDPNGMTLQQYKDFSASRVNPENSVIGEGAPYWSAAMEVSAEVVNWLQDIGVGFTTMGIRTGSTPFLAPGAYQGGAGYALEYLAYRAPQHGVNIIYSTKVTNLLCDDNGAVIGVEAEGEDGSTWNVQAKKVILASGGFGANQEKFDQYYPDYAGEVLNCAKGSTGDGIWMAMDKGADIECMGRTTSAFLSTYDTHYELAFIHYTTPGIIVNVNGDSIGNIMKNNHGMLSAAKADPSNGDTFYYVFDQAARLMTTKSHKSGLPFGVSYEPVFEKGEAVFYESVEKAAEELNLENLKETIDANNQAYLSGEDDAYGRSNATLPYIDYSQGLWMMRVEPTRYLTTGGLKTNLDGQILNVDNEPIANLYGAGDVIGSIEEKDGTGYGMGFDSALMYGYIVARNAAEALN